MKNLTDIINNDKSNKLVNEAAGKYKYRFYDTVQEAVDDANENGWEIINIATDDHQKLHHGYWLIYC